MKPSILILLLAFSFGAHSQGYQLKLTNFATGRFNYVKPGKKILVSTGTFSERKVKVKRITPTHIAMENDSIRIQDITRIEVNKGKGLLHMGIWLGTNIFVLTTLTILEEHANLNRTIGNWGVGTLIAFNLIEMPYAIFRVIDGSRKYPIGNESAIVVERIP